VYVGSVAFISSLYSHEIPYAAHGFGYWIMFAAISSLCGYASSRMNSAANPNLFRWLIMPLILLIDFLTKSFMLIGLYAYPKPDLFSQMIVFLVAMGSIAYLPPSLVMFGIAKEYIAASDV
jgi:hypothetical protein